jgi:hypothetical protein
MVEGFGGAKGSSAINKKIHCLITTTRIFRGVTPASLSSLHQACTSRVLLVILPVSAVVVVALVAVAAASPSTAAAACASAASRSTSAYPFAVSLSAAAAAAAAAAAVVAPT